jgi:hypothetical protein
VKFSPMNNENQPVEQPAEPVLEEVEKQPVEEPARDYNKNPDFLATPEVGLEQISPYAAHVIRERRRKRGFVSSCIDGKW